MSLHDLKYFNQLTIKKIQHFIYLGSNSKFIETRNTFLACLRKLVKPNIYTVLMNTDKTNKKKKKSINSLILGEKYINNSVTSLVIKYKI